jgi:hypothetical protein
MYINLTFIGILTKCTPKWYSHGTIGFFYYKKEQNPHCTPLPPSLGLPILPLRGAPTRTPVREGGGSTTVRRRELPYANTPFAFG